MEALTQTRTPTIARPRMTHQALLAHLGGADTDVLRRVLEHAMQWLVRTSEDGQPGKAAPEVRRCHERRNRTRRWAEAEETEAGLW